MKLIRFQRLMLILLLVVGVGTAASVMLYALSNNLNHFYSPTQIINGEAPLSRQFRAGGIVVPGTVERGEQLMVSFSVTDGSSEILMQYKGILPDLFREGQSVIGIGHLQQNKSFLANEILAKHDENYMPPEVQSALEKAAPHGVIKAKKTTEYSNEP